MEHGLIIGTLSNGVKVGNFSSPHSFTYVDGTVIPAVEASKSEALSVVKHETLVKETANMKTYQLDVELTPAIEKELDLWMKAWEAGEVDVVLIPSRVIQ